MKTNEKLYQWANIGALAGVVFINVLANALPINGITTGEVSDSYPNLFAPAGFTFAIWLVIYLLLAAFVVYQARGLLGGKPRPKEVLSRVGPYFAASSLFNMAWIFAWHYQRIGLSLVLMLLIFLSLAVIYTRLQSFTSREDFFFVQVPFSVYFGWISVATIANVTTYLVSIGWQGFGLSGAFWTVLVLLVGALVALANTLLRRDAAYLLVFVWAFIGILVKRAGGPEVYFSILAALAASLALFGFLLYRLFAPRRAG
jgi:hypothetical protein